MTDRAHARITDPETSHEAADAITPDINSLQQRVISYAYSKRETGFCDAQMEEELGDDGSTLRSRRAELAEMGLILDSGRRTTWGDSQRRRIIWMHRAFVTDGHRQVSDKMRRSSNGQPNGRVPDDLRDQVLGYASEFERFAASLRAEGRGMFAERCASLAQFLRTLAA